MNQQQQRGRVSPMHQLLQCGTASSAMLQPLLQRIQQSLYVQRGGGGVPKPGVPHKYIEWVDSIASQPVVFRLYCVLVHVHCDVAFRRYMLEGDESRRAIQFADQLEHELNAAMMGRKPGTLEAYSDEEIAAETGNSGWDRIPWLVARLQAFYLAL